MEKDNWQHSIVVHAQTLQLACGAMLDEMEKRDWSGDYQSIGGKKSAS